MPDERWSVVLGDPSQGGGFARSVVGPFDSREEAQAWVDAQPGAKQFSVLGIVPLRRPTEAGA
jgi:hypothetical protein